MQHLDSWVLIAASDAMGGTVFGSACSKCHGAQGAGLKDYQGYGRWPFVTISTRPLTTNHGGGTWDEFATRAAQGAHSTLPELDATAMLNTAQWKAVHAWVSQRKAGSAQVTTDHPPAPKNALLHRGEDYEVHLIAGKVAKIEAGTRTDVTSYADMRVLLPSAGLPEGAAETVVVKGWVDLDCVGTSCADATLGAPEDVEFSIGQ